MKTKLSIQQQIEDAKKTVEEWPEWLKHSTQLEGADPYFEQANRHSAEVLEDKFSGSDLKKMQA